MTEAVVLEVLGSLPPLMYIKVNIHLNPWIFSAPLQRHSSPTLSEGFLLTAV